MPPGLDQTECRQFWKSRIGNGNGNGHEEGKDVEKVTKIFSFLSQGSPLALSLLASAIDLHDMSTAEQKVLAAGRNMTSQSNGMEYQYNSIFQVISHSQFDFS